MKVPVLDTPSVAVRAAPTQLRNENLDTGLGDIGQAVGGAVANVGGIAWKAKLQADEMAADQAAVQYQMDSLRALHGGSDAVNQDFGLDLTSKSKDVAPNAFLSTKGLQAVGQSADVSAYLSKRQAEIEKSLPSNSQRELFRAKAQSIYQNSYKTIELHASRQFAMAEEATAKARVETALAAIESGYSDPDIVKSNTDVIFGIVRKGALSPEDAASRVAKADEEINGARLRQYLKSGDYGGAEELYNGLRGRLGPKEDSYGKAIGEMKLSRESEMAARAAVESARDPEGRVDADRVRVAVDRLGPGPASDEVRKRAEDRLADEERSWKGKVAKIHSRALTGFYGAGESLGGIDSQDRAWLIQNAPEKWGDISDLHAKKLARGRSEVSFRESRVLKAQRVQNAGAEEQTQAFIEFSADIAENPEKYRGMSADELQSDWRTRLGEKHYAAAGKIFASTQKEKPESASEFNAYVKSAIANSDALRNNKEAQKKFTGLMAEARRLKIEATGKPPTMDEFDDLASSVWKQEKNWFGISRTVLKKAEELSPTVAPVGSRVGAAPVGGVSRHDRIRQLLRAGKSKQEIAATLKNEGL